MNTELDHFLKDIEEPVSVNFASSEVSPGGPTGSFTISNSGLMYTIGDVHTNGYVHVEPSSIGPCLGDPSGGITWVTTTGSSIYPPAALADARVIQATPPRLEDIFVEVAKVIQKRGNISEVRDILNRHKLKVVDHDGEVIFDSEWDKKIKNQDL